MDPFLSALATALPHIDFRDLEKMVVSAIKSGKDREVILNKLADVLDTLTDEVAAKLIPHPFDLFVEVADGPTYHLVATALFHCFKNRANGV